MTPDELDNKFKIRLEGTISKDLVVFNTMPTISEQNSAIYGTLNPTHLIGNYHPYENSPSRKFDLGDIKLVSRNALEARRNLKKVLTLRAWTKSYFGDTGGPMGDQLKNWLGAPPEVLLFSAYASETNRGHMVKIPVVVENFSMSYPNDVDYIPTLADSNDDQLGGVPFPIITTVTVSLLEQHSAVEFEKFNLYSFKQGILPSF